MLDRSKFNTVLDAKIRPFDFHIKETLGYIDLIKLFVRRDFTAQYKQTVLGPLWALIQPLLTTVVFTLVFGSLAGLTTADTEGHFAIPAFLFYMSGNICWSYFSSSLQATSNTFINNRAVMGKVYFPRLAAPVSTVISKLISFSIQFLLFAVLWLVFFMGKDTDMTITPMLLLLPLLILQLALLALGNGMIMASITIKYRDLAMLVGFGLQLWQYASPLVYGLELVNSKIPEYMFIYMLNPISPIITTFRRAVFGFGYFSMEYYLLSWLVTLAVVFVGLMLFSRAERNFTDTI